MTAQGSQFRHSGEALSILVLVPRLNLEAPRKSTAVKEETP
jgi:hypothetical protein